MLTMHNFCWRMPGSPIRLMCFEDVCHEHVYACCTFCARSESSATRLPFGSSQNGVRLVWSSFNEGSDKGDEERAWCRDSVPDLSWLWASHSLLRWPLTPWISLRCELWGSCWNAAHLCVCVCCGALKGAWRAHVWLRLLECVREFSLELEYPWLFFGVRLWLLVGVSVYVMGAVYVLELECNHLLTCLVG